MTFDLDSYLERIGHPGRPEVSVACLGALHHAQVHTIPFENFDILLSRGISLDAELLFDKLVYRRRGGYCFELNGLFCSALQAIGFDARQLLARVHLGPEPTARTHQLTLVEVEGERWLADVGFGGPGLKEAIPFVTERENKQGDECFRLREAEPFGIVLQTAADNGWQNLYSFDLGHVFPADIACGNHFTSTHPLSFFTFTRVAAIPVPHGRKTLYDFSLRTTGADGEETSELPAGEGYLEALENHFGITLDATFDDIRPLHAKPTR